ncbi:MULTISPECIES: cyclase family protein [Actinomadura]|uniref:Kynurenine formamidase n=1 Tax=Actinomadura madurae TaxID=1993 RepID=A0A1I5PQ23_9ACTN|nr:cyclase family protein [Actinomadura madurae]SFP36123.1 Kynurenine formamidase [Actinomadura madurae]SPT64009.1 Putative cyclase [Actinomadura madurae]
MTVHPSITGVEFSGRDVLEDYIAKFSNWGRWGADDELGTINHVGPEQVKAAVALVTEGKVISLALPFDAKGPQPGNGLRFNPVNVVTASGTDHGSGVQEELPDGWGRAKGFGFADDMLITPNQAGTQWDSLSHIFWQGKMYNDRPARLVTANGAAFNAITVFRDRFVGRGVLLDVARYKGVDFLDPGYAITIDDLDGTAAAQGVEIATGDTIVIRTGMLGERRGDWRDYAGGSAPGLSLHTAPWLYEHNIGAVASDTWGVEVRPNEIDVMQPLHLVALVHMGMPVGEIWDVDALAADCAADGRYEFMLAAQPLPITGAVGSPTNPLAFK